MYSATNNMCHWICTLIVVFIIRIPLLLLLLLLATTILIMSIIGKFGVVRVPTSLSTLSLSEDALLVESG
jgi:hypothetical protein